MRFRRLGDAGLAVSVVGLGCNNFGRRLDAEQTRAVVDAAIEAGITLFDTSDSYGESETFLGAALQGRRDDVVVATKFGSDLGGRLGADWGARASRRYIRKAVESSLGRLRTDWIDLYQLHFPDPATPLEETLAALHELVQEGKVRYVGCSNLAAWQLTDADWIARTRGYTRFVSAQNHYSLLEREVEKELVPACRQLGVGSPALLPARQRPAHRQVPTRRAAPAGHPVGGTAGPARAGGVRHDRGAGDLRRGARPVPARRRDRRARRPAAGLVGDRRGDEARAGARQRGGGGMGADAGRPGGAGRDPGRRRPLTEPIGRPAHSLRNLGDDEIRVVVIEVLPAG